MAPVPKRSRNITASTKLKKQDKKPKMDNDAMELAIKMKADAKGVTVKAYKKQFSRVSVQKQIPSDQILDFDINHKQHRFNSPHLLLLKDLYNGCKKKGYPTAVEQAVVEVQMQVLLRGVPLVKNKYGKNQISVRFEEERRRCGKILNAKQEVSEEDQKAIEKKLQARERKLKVAEKFRVKPATAYAAACLRTRA